MAITAPRPTSRSQGLNVTATGQMSFSASGNASAELKASGTLKVQGALVQIN